MRIRFLRPLFIILVWAMLTAVAPTHADHTPTPQSVTIAGTIQTALGCSADWQPECTASQLTFSDVHQLWIATFDLPAGSYEYKAALNGSWDENYGAGAQQDGPNIPLTLDAARPVTFLYDHNSHWITDNVNSILANVPGSFNGELGCPVTGLSTPDGDWAPDCLRTWLQDPDGDGIYTFSTTAIPAGNYEAKVAINQSWSENYGDGGAPGGSNIGFTVVQDNAETFFAWDANTKVLTISAEGAPKGSLVEARTYWVRPDLIAAPFDPEPGVTFSLHIDPNGRLQLTGDGIQGGEAIPLTVDAAGLPAAVTAQFPHLAGRTALRLPAAAAGRAAELLRGQFALSVVDAGGALVDATSLQIPGVLDSLYPYDGPLGVTFDGDTPTLRVWAPTAQSVRLQLFPDANPASSGTAVPMQRDEATGVWSVTGQPGWRGQYYLYEVTVFAPRAGEIVTNLVTDPYAFSLALNSRRSQIVDLADPTLAPAGWNGLAKPPLARFEDIVLYELHIRDFSVSDPAVPAAHQGTYLAFTHTDSHGMRHLRALAAAGLTHIHLLPLFDIATINENKAEWNVPDDAFLAQFAPDSQRQQAALVVLRDEDGFNWGYDPFHYTVPEGSYSTNPDGPARIVEFRQMVQALNQNGLRVVMDVVYNHTNASGQGEKSVLDRIVPGYYHRLNSKGTVETSTCCPNTATEHRMMRKLMIDSVVTWATQYKVDGFRFDLMGHHMKEDMLAVRAALDSLTLAEHGVDGAKIYVYGEGWNFGEVANNARGVNATQLNMAGTGIGSFNDRLRDAARGGNPFGGEQEQGFINGLYYDPNATDQGSREQQLARLLHFADQIRVGLAGNLADYRFVGASGSLVRGAEVDYNGAPAGYTADPQENIIYVSAHDNETLFDAIQYKAPVERTTAERARMQMLGLDLVMLSQGVPFFHAGSDMLRSKSLDRNSYNSGDWFNRLDFTYQSNNWGVGLPPAPDNESKWGIMRPLLANPDLKPAPEDIQAAVAHFQEMLRIRRSSPLFRLETAAEVQARLRFHNTGPNQVPGLIVMSLDDTAGPGLDPRYDRIVVLFNAGDEPRSFNMPELRGARFELHPVQQNSADPVVREARFFGGLFEVPAQTTAVFVQPGGPPGGIPSWPGWLAVALGLLAIIWAWRNRER